MASTETEEPAEQKSPDATPSIPVDILILTYSDDIESSLEGREPDFIVTTLEIHKCPSTLAASKLIYNHEFLSSIFTQFPSVVAIKLKIDKDFVKELVDKPVVAGFTTKENILVSFETATAPRVVFWKNSHNGPFLKLEFNDNDEHSRAVNEFALNFLIQTLRSGRSAKFTSSHADLTSLVDTTGRNLLMAAIDSQDMDAFRQLLKLPFDINQKTNSGGKTAADNAWQRGRQDILLELLQANSTYPNGFSSSKTSPEVRKFLAIASSVHAAIDDGKVEQIKEILSQNPNLQHFYNSENASAVTAALISKNCDIYVLLSESNVTFGAYEDVESILNEHLFDNPAMQQGICKINSKMAKSIEEKHVLILRTYSVVAHDNQNARQLTGLIKEAFDVLNSCPVSRQLLRVAATCKTIKIHFDCQRSSVQAMDPQQNSSTGGACYTRRGHIYVAAKDLLVSTRKFAAIAILDHEICHLVLHMVFHNNGKPYAVGDAVNEARFAEIIQICKQLKQHEAIVNWVFDYDEKDQAAELIVRVPHMLIHYRNNEAKLAELKATFDMLFLYWTEVVEPAVEASLPILEKLSNPTINIVYNDLSESLKAAIGEGKVNFHGQIVKLNGIYDKKPTQIVNQLTSKQIRDTLEGETIVIGKEWETTSKIYVERNFLALNSDDDAEGEPFESIATKVCGNKMFLLSDHAGAGKSTTMKQLSLKLKQKFPTFWVEYVDLKRHLKTYDKFEKELAEKRKSNEMTDETAEYDPEFDRFDFGLSLEILKEMLALGDGLESVVFTELIELGKVILLLDGVDEIAPKFKEFFFALIKSVQSTSNAQQWIATRPQHIEDLTMLFEQRAYKLKPLNEDNIGEIIGGVMACFKITDPEAITMAINLVTKVSRSLRFINNPLMLKMLTELHIAGKLSLTNLNRFLVYEAMIELKKDILAQKKGAVANRDLSNDSKVSLWDIHKLYAALLIIGELFEDFLKDNRNLQKIQKMFSKNVLENNISVRKLQIFVLWETDIHKWSVEAISRSGLLILDFFKTNREYPDFVHRTFAEYFLAKFLIEIAKEAIESDELNNNEFEIRMKLVVSIIVQSCTGCGDFNIVGDFVQDYLANQQPLKMGKNFTKFLKKNATFVCDLIYRKCQGNSAGEIKFALFQLSFLKLFNFDVNLSKLLKISEGRQLKLFKTLFDRSITDTSPEASPETSVRLFECLKNADLPKWQEVVGYENNLTGKTIGSLTNEELENLFENDFLLDIYEDGNDVNANPVEEMKHFQQLSNFLSFIIGVGDYPTDKAEKFVRSYCLKHLTFILRSRSIVEKLLTVIRSYFASSNNLTAIVILLLNTLGEKISQFDAIKDSNIETVRPLIPKFVENIKFLADALTACYVEKSMREKLNISIFTFAVVYNIDSIKQFFREHFLSDDLYDLLHTNIPKLRSAEIIRFSTVFQLLFNFHSNFATIADFLVTLKRDFGEAWQDHTGYQRKSQLSKSDDPTDFPAGLSFEQIEELTAIFTVLRFINQSEIPHACSARFMRNHLGSMLKYDIFSRRRSIDELFDALALCDDHKFLFETLKQRIQSTKFLNTSSKEEFELYDHIMSRQLKLYFDLKYSMSDFRITEFDTGMHPLLTCFKMNMTKTIKMYQKYLKGEDIVKIFIQNIQLIESLMADVSSCIVEDFLTHYLEANSIKISLKDFRRKLINEAISKDETQLNMLSLVYQLLNILKSIEPSSSFFDDLGSENVSFSLAHALKSCRTVELLFEVFQKAFSGDERKATILLENALRKCGIYEPENVAKYSTVKSQQAIEDFWLKTQNFLAESPNLMRVVLCGQNIFRNVVHFAIYHNIKSIPDYYVECFYINETFEVILECLTENTDTLAIEKVVQFIEQIYKRYKSAIKLVREEFKPFLNAFEEKFENLTRTKTSITTEELITFCKCIVEMCHDFEYYRNYCENYEYFEQDGHIYMGNTIFMNHDEHIYDELNPNNQRLSFSMLAAN